MCGTSIYPALLRAIIVAFSTEKFCGVVVLYRGDGPTRKNETPLKIKLLTFTLIAAVTLNCNNPILPCVKLCVYVCGGGGGGQGV